MQYRRIDRKDAKLLMQGEARDFLEAAGGNQARQYTHGTGPATLVWLVAIAGDIRPPFAHGRQANWELTIFDAGNGQFLGSL